MYVTRPNRSTASGLKYEVLGLGGYLPMHTCTRTHTHKYIIYYMCLFIVTELKLKIDQQPKSEKARNVVKKFPPGKRASEGEVGNLTWQVWPARPSLRAPISLCVFAYEVPNRMVYSRSD